MEHTFNHDCGGLEAREEEGGTNVVITINSPKVCGHVIDKPHSRGEDPLYSATGRGSVERRRGGETLTGGSRRVEGPVEGRRETRSN